MKVLRLVVIVACIGFLSLGLANAANRSGKVVDFQGSVDVKIGKNDWAPVVKEAILQQGDAIRTSADSVATIELADAGIVEIKPNSELGLAELTSDTKNDSRRTVLDLAIGEILIKAKKLSTEKSRFEVKTPTSVIGVRGTAFSVKVDTVTE